MQNIEFHAQDAQILKLTVKATDAETRCNILDVERHWRANELNAAQTAIQRAQDAKALRKATDALAPAQNALNAISDELAKEAATLRLINSQIAALEAEKLRGENFNATASWADYGVRLRDEFDAILLEVEAQMRDGFKRLSAKRDQQRATREGWERAVLSVSPNLASDSPLASSPEFYEKQSSGFAFRGEMARRGVDSLEIGIVTQGECEPHQPALSSDFLGAYVKAHDGSPLVLEIVARLKIEREAVRFGRPSVFLPATGVQFVAPLSNTSGGSALLPEHERPFPLDDLPSPRLPDLSMSNDDVPDATPSDPAPDEQPDTTPSLTLIAPAPDWTRDTSASSREIGARTRDGSASAPDWTRDTGAASPELAPWTRDLTGNERK